jgi:peroxiredoxin
MIELHRELPVLQLRDQRGALVSTWSYKHQKPLVIAFAGTDASLLAGFADRIGDYVSANAQVLAVAQGDPGGDDRLADVPFPVFADESGDVSSRYVDVVPATVVTDAYGVVEGIFLGPPDHGRIIDLVRLLEMRCPECGVPEWPAE